MKILILGKNIEYFALVNLLNHFFKEANLPKYSIQVSKNYKDEDLTFVNNVKKYASHFNLFVEDVNFFWENCDILSDLNSFYKNIYEVELIITINLNDHKELVNFFASSNKIEIINLTI